MNPKTSAQDVHRCELCEENMVDMLCIVCPQKLCKSCVGNHLDDDPGKHELVKYQDRNTALVLPTCDEHSSERCKNYCKECDKAVCPSCISSDSHERHKFLKISEKFVTKKEIIRKETQELEQAVYPAYKGIVEQAESNVMKLEEGYETLEQKIEKQRKKWHELIDTIVNKLKNENGDMKKKQLKALNEHLQKLKELLAEVRGTIDSNKDILNSSNVSKSLSYTSRNQSLKQFPAKLEVSVPCFLSQPMNSDVILEMFGVVTGFSISNQDGGYNPETQSKPAASSGKGIDMELINEPQIISIIETEIEYPENVACQRDGKIWIAGSKGKLKMFYGVPLNVSRLSFGVVGSSFALKELESETDECPKDIALTRSGDLIYGKKLQNVVNIARQNKTDELINLHDWGLLSFCTTSCGELLVAMTDDRKYRCRVVRFEGSKERQIIQYDHEGKPLYTSGMLRKYVKENQNGDICVADCNAGAVVVTDRAGKFRFRYTGSTLSQQEAQFRPVGITTDRQAHILVSDSLNVHIVDMNGQFLCFLNLVFNDPLRIATDSEDNLYVVETSGIVKKVRYLTELKGTLTEYIPGHVGRKGILGAQKKKY